MKKEALILQDWDDIVFENRNKDYGAFLIRRSYSKNVVEGLLGSALACALFLLLPGLTSFFTGEKIQPMAAKDWIDFIVSPPPVIQPQQINKRLTPPTKQIEKNEIPALTSDDESDEIGLTKPSNPTTEGIGNDEGEIFPADGNLVQGNDLSLPAAQVPSILKFAEVMPHWMEELRR